MSWIGKIALAIALRALVKTGDKLADSHLTDKRAKEQRRQIEDYLYRLAQRKQTGWFAKTVADDKGLWYAQVVFKSRWLDQKLSTARP